MHLKPYGFSLFLDYFLIFKGKKNSNVNVYIQFVGNDSSCVYTYHISWYRYVCDIHESGYMLPYATIGSSDKGMAVFIFS